MPHRLQNRPQSLFRGFQTAGILLKILVGASGFEPPASCSRSRRSSQAEPRPDAPGMKGSPPGEFSEYHIFPQLRLPSLASLITRTGQQYGGRSHASARLAWRPPPLRATLFVMSLTERIQADLTAAMKLKDELRLSVLRMAKSALKHREIEKMRPLEEAEELQILQMLVKQRRESAEQFEKGGRADLAEKELREISIVETYLPAAASEDAVRAAIDAAISETGAKSPQQMGAVIKAARARLAGTTVDGKRLSDLVRERLSQA
jgi:uncharacterized protein